VCVARFPIWVSTLSQYYTLHLFIYKNDASFLDTQNQTIRGQIAALRIESAQQEAEWMRRVEANSLQAEQNLSDIKVKANTELTER
jgi:hypothetical protein